MNDLRCEIHILGARVGAWGWLGHSLVGPGRWGALEIRCVLLSFPMRKRKPQLGCPDGRLGLTDALSWPDLSTRPTGLLLMVIVFVSV